MNNRLEFEKGVRLEPVTSTDIDQKGELEVLSTGGKLNYHNGTTASPVVTESHTAELINKTIDGDDNTIQDVALTSLKTVIADANKIIKRNASGVVVSSTATLDASDNLKIPGTIYTGSSTIDASAILQVDSTAKGAIFPRMTTAQRNAIASPANGLWIFNTETRIFEYYDSISTSWSAVGAGSGGVVLTAQQALGTGDGSTVSFGPIDNVPNSEEAVLVTIDGVVESEANWSLSGSNIIFSIAPAAAQTIYVYYMYGAGPGGGGEANTASNMGTGADGEGLATTKVGVDLPFKRIKAGTNVTLTSQTNDILIDVTIPPPPVSERFTGEMIDYVGSTAPSGWILASGLTIGNASSSATGRANADTSDLITLLWNSMGDTQAPVSGGRGANAAADFAANKNIRLPDLRGRVAVGKDDMGGTTASRMTGAGSGITGTTLGFFGGTQTHTLITSETPSHTHNTSAFDNFSSVYGNASGSAGNRGTYGGGTTLTTADAKTSSIGSGGAHQNTQPSIILNKIIKL